MKKKKLACDIIAQQFFDNKEREEKNLKERLTVKRLTLIMALVNLLLHIENVKNNKHKKVLRLSFDEVLKEVKFTEQEKIIFDYECSNIGI